jgi:hypothetical protein
MLRTMPSKKLIVSMKLPKAIPALITRCLAIWQAMSADKQFADCDPSLTQLKADIDALQAAQVDVEAGKPGAVTVRDDKESVVRTDFQHLKMYLQRRGDANPSQAAEIYKAADCDVQKPSTRKKPPHELFDGPVSGSVIIRLLAAIGRASYVFQYSLDQKTWTSSPGLPQATYTFHGLTPGQTYYFRWQVTTTKGTADWSQPVAWLVR